MNVIRSARPPRLYVVADGPRSGVPGELDRCNEARLIASQIDWPCELHTLFRRENFGCKKSVSEGIDWFYDQEEEGIILEDDVLPVSSFFNYCDELLEKYRHDTNVGIISGSNFVGKYYKVSSSYIFSRNAHIWGWASWRRVWRNYDVSMSLWPIHRKAGLIESVFPNDPQLSNSWISQFDDVYSGQIDTWDAQLAHMLWSNAYLSILPAINQTQNLGFGVGAAHTTGSLPKYIKDSPPIELTFPLIHPSSIAADPKIDNLINKYVFGESLLDSIKIKVRSIPLLGSSLADIRNFLRRFF